MPKIPNPFLGPVCRVASGANHFDSGTKRYCLCSVGRLEWHCQHAPIGLDSVKAEGICQAIAQRMGGGAPGDSDGSQYDQAVQGLSHSIDFSGELVAEVAAAFCSQLADEGFRIVVLLTGTILQSM